MSVATIYDVKHISRIREIYVVKIITLPPLGSPWQEKYVKYANFVSLWVRDSRPRAKPHSKNVINLKKVSFLPLSYIVRETKCKYMVMSTCIIPLLFIL